MVWRKGHPAHNRIDLSSKVKQQIKKDYRTKQFTIDQLRAKHGLGRNKMIKVLKELLRDEYAEIAKSVVAAHVIPAIKQANIGRKHIKTIWSQAYVYR